jgi:hypothetical protein
MAMIECAECGNEVSSKVASCPKCGVRYARKPLGFSGFIGVLLLGVVLLTAFSSILSSGSSSGTSSPPSSSKPPETPEQKAERERKDAAVQRATVGAVVLKKSMRDPESFKLESALVIDGSRAVCYDYRAKNGFGGTNVGQAVLAGDGTTFKTSEMAGFTRLWNKECASKTGTEAGTAIRWFAL